jgi:hypothetical protein
LIVRAGQVLVVDVFGRNNNGPDELEALPALLVTAADVSFVPWAWAFVAAGQQRARTNRLQTLMRPVFGIA